MAIIGLDISGRDKFAYTIVEQGVVVEQGIEEPLTILKIIKKYKPNILVVDSITELLEYGKIIIKALGRAPFNIDIVQITKAGDDLLSVEELVRKNFGISKSRLDPLETSMYIALLAEKGLGTRVKLYEEETVILIKRRSSTAPGGMSRNRYMRNIKHRIRDIAEKVAKRLNEVGLDYDVFFKGESGDIASAKFIVYARRDLVRKYIKPLRSSDIIVDIFSEIAKGSEIERREDQYLIVGVDPGIVTGLAVMDLSGVVLYTEARRGLSRGEALRRIYQWGTPVVVATDVANPPEYVKKLAAMCGAVLHHPERDLSIEEKNMLLERLKYKAPTTHERDALAAAYKAFIELKIKFDKLEKDFGNILNYNQINKAKILIAKNKSIAQAVAEVLREESSQSPTKLIYIPVEKPCKNIDDELKRRITVLEYENTQLSKEVEELRREVASLTRALDDAMWRDMKYRELRQRIESLTRSLQECNNLREALTKEVIDIIQGIINGKYKLYRENDINECKIKRADVCKDISNLEEAIKNGIVGVPLNLVLKKKLGEYYIIDEEEKIKILNYIKGELLKQNIDLKKILNEYRRIRKT
ncbi:MAG: DUF460 domain-containing protein [Thermoproteus sp.]|nr:DUF460 domain-containing protein [Thermoproteus sp.]